MGTHFSFPFVSYMIQSISHDYARLAICMATRDAIFAKLFHVANYYNDWWSVPGIISASSSLDIIGSVIVTCWEN